MNEQKLDFLRELAVIGTGHATIALSQMLQGRMFKLVVPDAQMLPFTEAADYMGGLEQVVVGIFVVISGDVRGYMACLHPLDTARLLVRLLTGQETEEIDELGRSALQELGNIMVTSFLNALSKMTNLLMSPVSLAWLLTWPVRCGKAFWREQNDQRGNGDSHSFRRKRGNRRPYYLSP